MEIKELLQIMSRLRGPKGCPWDKKQTHESLRPYVIEEAFELVDAIEGGDNGEVQEELGDILLQIIFHCQIAQEEERFTFDDVIRTISDKLIRRHPHVFGDENAADEEEALQNWERIKAEKEGKRRTRRHRGTPILHRALRIQEKAVGFGFDSAELTESAKENLDQFGQALSDLLNQCLMYKGALHRYTDLSRMIKASFYQQWHNFIKVGILCNNNGSRSSMLQCTTCT